MVVGVMDWTIPSCAITVKKSHSSSLSSEQYCWGIVQTSYRNGTLGLIVHRIVQPCNQA